MTTPKLKSLLKVAAEVINLHLDQQDGNPTDPTYIISPWYDNSEKDSEMVNIHFTNWEFNYEFLEPLATLLSRTKIKWSITRQEKEFQISLYY
jgi:hypothetical protein